MNAHTRPTPRHPIIVLTAAAIANNNGKARGAATIARLRQQAISESRGKIKTNPTINAAYAKATGK